jgi:hypothetical protein
MPGHAAETNRPAQKISMGLTLDQLARRLRCSDSGGSLLSVKPWRQADASGKAGSHADLISFGVGLAKEGHKERFFGAFVTQSSRPKLLSLQR